MPSALFVRGIASLGAALALWLVEPGSAVDRQAWAKAAARDTPFLIPPPPPRRGPGDVAGASAPVEAGARVWRVGPRSPHARIADVARLARDGDVVEIEAGDYRGDVAVWQQSRLTIRGVGGAARLHADGAAAEGKAIWVIRRGHFLIENIDFIGARVPDRNGAGIRFEGGHLRLRGCLFWGNETGLLTANADTAANAELVIEGSEFAYSHVPGRWAHHLYVGSIARLELRGNHFHRTDRGHLVKSRASRSELRYNRFADDVGGRASYELDFPNGGDVLIVGNVIQQGPATDNPVIVSYGEEGYRWAKNRLLMASNTIVNDGPSPSVVLRVDEGPVRVVAANNFYIGPGRLYQAGRLLSWNEHRSDSLVSAPRPRYRPFPDASIEAEMRPTGRYVHPLRVEPLTALPSWVGAGGVP